MYCKECGNLLEESDLICKVCGADIREQRRQAASGTALAGVSADERAEAGFAFARDEAEETNAFDEREAFSLHETDGAGTEIAPGGAEAEAGTESASESGPSETADLESILPEADLSEVLVPGERLEDASPADDASEAEASPELPASENIPEEAPRKPTFGEFRWNIHEFPNTASRRTEDIDFNWNMSPSSVRFQEASDDAQLAEAEELAADTEELAAGAEEDIIDADAEEISFDKLGDAFFALFEESETDARDAETPVDFAAPDARDDADDGYIQDFLARETDAPAEEDGGEIAAPAPALAKAGPELFAPAFESGAETPGNERFFTFNQKNEEFQKLLDREYERLRAYNSPILNEAREMLAAWDWPGFEGKQTDPATKRWSPSAFRERLEPEGDPGPDAPPAPEAPQDGGASADEESEATAPEESVSHAKEFPPEETEAEALSSVEEMTADAGRTPDGEPGDRSPGEEPGAEQTLSAEEAGADRVPAEASADPAPEAQTEAKLPPDITEAELAISKTLDSIEKEIADWENRDRLSTASKAAVILSAVFLLCTGGAAAVKHFAPHSPVDVWFDSVQLQAASTIKHGVDAIRDLFDGSDEGEAENDSGSGDGEENVPGYEPGGGSAAPRRATDGS
jgi:hypothetical protein